MRIVEFLFAIIDKHAPMQEHDRNELRRDANDDYATVRDTFWDNIKKKMKDGVDPKKLNIKQRLVRWSEYWPVRTALALLFMWISPMIQEYMNPSADPFDEDDEP